MATEYVFMVACHQCDKNQMLKTRYFSFKSMFSARDLFNRWIHSYSEKCQKFPETYFDFIIISPFEFSLRDCNGCFIHLQLLQLPIFLSTNQIPYSIIN